MSIFKAYGPGVAALLLATTGTAAWALQKAPDQASAKAAGDRRRDLLAALGDQMDKKLKPVVRGPAFNAADVKATAVKMAGIAAQIPAAFNTDTRGYRFETSAKDDVWATYPDFVAKSKGLNGALVNLQKAADGGQRDQVVQAVMQVGQACKTCHTAYKAD